jgi:pyrroline-5-carboxylate reductase
MATRILLIGCGKMGGALLHGWRNDPALGPFVTVEPGSGDAAFRGLAGVTCVKRFEDIPADFAPDAIVVATKPQGMETVLPPYRALAKTAVVLSIAAGRRIAFLESHLGDIAAIRAMPNTPAAIGRGISVCVANARATNAQRDLATKMMAAVGEVGWVADEDLIDAVTAVSGSGPAYVFLLAETLAAAGVKAGLPEDLALRLARATVSGAGELLHRAPETAEQLRKNVTSPKGTTQAALDVLMAPDGLAPLMEKAVRAARDRGRELAG